MSGMDKRAALVWLIAVTSAIGLWMLMTGGPALAEEMLPRSRDWVLVLAGIAVWTVFLALVVGWWTA